MQKVLLFLMGCFMLSATLSGAWHVRTQDRVLESVATAATRETDQAVQNARQDLRLDVLEKQMAELEEQHRRLLWLLIGTLAAVLTNITTNIRWRRGGRH